MTVRCDHRALWWRQTNEWANGYLAKKDGHSSCRSRPVCDAAEPLQDPFLNAAREAPAHYFTIFAALNDLAEASSTSTPIARKSAGKVFAAAYTRIAINGMRQLGTSSA